MKRILTILFIAFTSYAFSQIPSKGLMGYWPFNGNANDMSGKGNHGTVTGASLVSDRFGRSNKAYFFNGSSDFISIGQPVPDSLQCTNGITISVWIKPDAMPATVGGIIAGQNDFNYTGYSLFINNLCTAGGSVLGGIHFQMMNKDIGYYAPCNGSNGYTNKVVSRTAWTHVVSTWSAGNHVKLYYNDTLVANWDAWAGPISYSETNILTIGKHDATINTDGNNNRWYSGLIDDIRIYNRQLDSVEVDALYKENFTGINESGREQNFMQLYPNPANSQLIVYSDLDDSKNNFAIINTIGTIVISGKINAGNTIIDISTLPVGIYLVKTTDGNYRKFQVVK